MNIEEIKNKVLPIFAAYGARRVALFGSSASGRSTAASDIDLLVELNSDFSLLKFIELKQRLEETLGKKVDLVEYATIKPLLREIILKQKVDLL